MTGLGKYQLGLELEAEGLTNAQIAQKLGYKDAQAWANSKYYYAKKQAAFNARAVGKPSEHPAPLPKEKKPELPTEEVKKPAKLEFLYHLEAFGANHVYEIDNGVIFATETKDEVQALRVSLEHWEALKAEVDQVIARYKEVSK